MKWLAGSSLRAGLDIVSSVVMILAAIALVAFGAMAASRTPAPRKAPTGKTIAVPAEPIDISAAAIIGSDSAPVTVVEFSDFQCPFCGQFARETMPVVKKQLVESGLVRVAFVQLPLGRIHPLAIPAARMAVCGKTSGRFWDLHDAFFDLPRTAEMKDYVAAAVKVGLPKLELGKCSGTLGKAAVDRDVALAKNLGVTGTPSFLFAASAGGSKVSGREWLSGAVSFDRFKEAVDRVRAQPPPSR